MVNAQEYINQQYSNKDQRKLTTKLDFSPNLFQKDLEGPLDLSDFVNLEVLNCRYNKLASLNLSKCFKLKEINCSHNQLTQLNLPYPNQISSINVSDNYLQDLSFLSALSSEKMTGSLSMHSNNFPKQDLSIFSRFINLKYLFVDNGNQEKINKGIYNRFMGSLEPLKDLNKLDGLNVNNTDINSGLEHLPGSIKYFNCSNDKRKDAKVKNIYVLFADEQGKVEIEKVPIDNSKFHCIKNFPRYKQRIVKIYELLKKEYEKQLANKNQELTKLMGELKKEQQDRTQLTQEITELTQKREDLETQLDQKEESLKKKSEENLKDQIQITQLTQEITELIQKTKDLETQLEELKISLQEKTTIQLKKKEKELQKLDQQVITKEEQLAKAKQKIKTLKEELSKEANQAERMEIEKKLIKVEVTLEFIEKEKISLKERIKELKQKPLGRFAQLGQAVDHIVEFMEEIIINCQGGFICSCLYRLKKVWMQKQEQQAQILQPTN